MNPLSKRAFLAGVAGLASNTLGGVARASGKEYFVEMRSSSPVNGEMQVFDPPVLKIDVGDTVIFQPTDNGHNSVSDPQMIPEGAKPWKGKINQEFSVTLDKPGVYGYYCAPHRSAGMVGLIMVGVVTEEQLAAAAEVRQRAKARQRYDRYFQEAKALLA